MKYLLYLSWMFIAGLVPTVVLAQSQCIPKNSCASVTCVGDTCSDGCGGLVNGTKTCKATGTTEPTRPIVPVPGSSVDPTAPITGGTSLPETSNIATTPAPTGTSVTNNANVAPQPQSQGSNNASTSLIPCGRSSGPPEEMVPCTICHIIVGGNRLITWGRNVMTIIAVTVIVAMGILYIVSAGNEGLMKTAKSGMTAALVGFAIMLTAWLIVNVILNVLVDKGSPDKPFLGLMQDGRFYFFCDTRSNANR